MERERVRERTSEPPQWDEPSYYPTLGDLMQKIEELQDDIALLNRERRRDSRQIRRLQAALEQHQRMVHIHN